MTELADAPARTAGTELRRVLDCPVVLPGDPGYERARRVWNGHIDRRPAAVVRCTTPADVRTALAVVADTGAAFTVRGGGHNVSGNSVVDDGVVLDLSALDQVRIDPGAGTVTAGAGATMGDVDRATAPHGLVVPAGVVSHTGVAGLTLGGGTGYLSRLYGATCDHVEAFRFVGADGAATTVTAHSDPDLFWALRGAGHNFGIVTAFTFRPRRSPGLAHVRQTFYAAGDRARAIRTARDWIPTAPDEVTLYVRLLTAPPYWSQLPREHHGRPVLAVGTVHYGASDDETGRAVTDPVHRAADPIWHTEYRIPHVTLQHSCDDDYPHGVNRYWKPHYLTGMPDELIDIALDWADRYPGSPQQARSRIALQPVSAFEFISRGGALARLPHDASAYSDRSSPWTSNIGADWRFPDEEEPLVAWARGFSRAIAPHSAGSYVNFLSEEVGTDETRRIFHEGYERLAAVKRRHDPDNLFRHGGLDLR